jgi:hypothetical protein
MGSENDLPVSLAANCSPADRLFLRLVEELLTRLAWGRFGELFGVL